jgi:tetratricopeptide (TPR) repeat protein
VIGKRLGIGLTGLALAGAAALLFIPRSNAGGAPRVVYTFGEVQTVHAELRVGEREVRGVARFGAGEVIATGADGRGRMRLDDGTSVVIDRNTRLKLGANGLELETGRIFVQGAARARTALTLGAASTLVSASALGLERNSAQTSLYCANGEVVVRAYGKQARVRSGETLSVTSAALNVAPEQAWNDWTGGMATPWSATGRPRAAIGEVWSRPPGASEEGGSALAIRAHDVTVSFAGEMARTRVETSYFNAGAAAMSGDFRMAVPPAAIVSRFALRHGDNYREGVVYVGKASAVARGPRLEWAGTGWLRGFAPDIAPGATLTVVVEYVEWLSPVGGRLTYRYPMLSDGPAPLIGELRVRVDTSGAQPRSVAVGGGAALHGNVVELHGADVRPEADFVVQLEVAEPPAQRAHAYLAHGGTRDPQGDDYVLVRAPLPAAAASPGVALALVLDTSWSIAPASLEAGRALIEAVLEGLGAQDRVSVLAADQATRAIGPAGCLPVDAARRASVRAELAALRPAGASDLGAALEQAADTLPKDASGALLVYIGDGWPTVGDTSVDALRVRLSRRSGGVPRIAAIALGALANRYLLRALSRSTGPVLDVNDREEAAQAAVSLLAGALEPALDGVEIDLGPNVDRVYPRGAQTVAADGVASVVGRLRGVLPASLTVRYRRAGQSVEETRPLDRSDLPQGGDIRRRWTAARLEDIALRGEAMDGVADLAARARLLTPLTGFYIDADANSAVATPIDDRLLELATPPAAYGGDLAGHSGALFEPEPAAAADTAEDFRSLIAASARRTLEAALPAIRRCRDARSAVHPELSSTLEIRLTIDGGGHASQVHVTQPAEDDRALDRCVAMLVSALSFFDSGTTTSVAITHEVQLPPVGEARARRCSQTSTLPLALRRGIWAERLRSARHTPSDFQQRARRACELPSWADQRVLLDLVVRSIGDGAANIEFARQLAALGETDAAEYVRHATIQRCACPAELARVRMALLGAEPKPGLEFERQYRAADSDDKRLSVLQRFLRLSPHDATLRRALLSLLEKRQQRALLLHVIGELRADPFVDAGVLADAAAALLRLDRVDDARRAFGELIERAPSDPYARAYAGDRLRDVGLFDDAAAAYESLEPWLAGDPAAALRLALAHAGAGRLDVASRVLERVAQTGGRDGDSDLAQLASIIEAVLLAEARGRAQGDELARLERRALEVPLPDLAGLVLVRTPRLDQPVAPRLVRASGERSELPPELSAPSLGVYVMRLERGDQDVRVLLRRPDVIATANTAAVRVDVLSIDDNRVIANLVHRDLLLAADGRPQELHWQAGGLL